jgi:hypothetical protein
MRHKCGGARPAALASFEFVTESPVWVKRVGRAVLACRLHPGLRTYGCDAGTDASGQQRNWKVVDPTVLIPGILLKLDLAIALIGLK